MAKPWAEKWGAEDVWSEYKSYDKQRRVEIMLEDLRRARQATSRRISTLRKHESVSYAEYALERQLEENFIGGRPNFKAFEAHPMQYYNSIEKALRIFHNFWGAKTSTVKGALAEQKAQGRRIFGVKEGQNPVKGEPVKVLNYKESKLYWKLYEEFWNQHQDISRNYSNRVQFNMGEIFTPDVMNEMLKTYDPDAGLDSIDYDVSGFLQAAYEKLLADQGLVAEQNQEAIDSVNEGKPSFLWEVDKNDD